MPKIKELPGGKTPKAKKFVPHTEAGNPSCQPKEEMPMRQRAKTARGRRDDSDDDRMPVHLRLAAQKRDLEKLKKEQDDIYKSNCTFRPAIDKKSVKMVEKKYGPVHRNVDPNFIGNPSLVSAHQINDELNHDLNVEPVAEPQRGYVALYAMHKEKLAKLEQRAREKKLAEEALYTFKPELMTQ